VGNLYRAVRGQFDARVLPDLVLDLPGNATAHGLVADWLLCDPALYRRLGRGVVRRMVVGPSSEDGKLSQCGSQTAHRQRPPARLHHRYGLTTLRATPPWSRLCSRLSSPSA